MLTVETLPGTNIVEVNFSGALHVEDEESLHSALRRAIDEHGTIRMLASIGTIDLGRTEPAAAWLDAKAAAFVPHIHRIALVTERGLLATLSGLAAKLIPGVELRTFEPAERATAETWLRS